MFPRLCTSCPIPHVTSDWYVIEFAHPRAGEVECAAAHERRIPLEVRDFGLARPPAPLGKPGRPKRTPSLASLFSRKSA